MVKRKVRLAHLTDKRPDCTLAKAGKEIGHGAVRFLTGPL